MTDVATAKAAWERGRAVVIVSPPAPECATALWQLVGAEPSPIVLICNDSAAAVMWAAAVPTAFRFHAVSGLGRSERLLKQGAVDVLAGSPQDLAALVTRSALKLDQTQTIVLAWPETLAAGDQMASVDTLLAEAREARRVVLSWNPRALETLLTSYAHHAPFVGAVPVDEAGQPAPPVGAARYAVVSSWRRDAAVFDVLDVLDPAHPYVWRGGSVTVPSPCDAVVATQLPSREELGALRAGGSAPVILVSADQVAYLTSIAQPLTALRLPSAADLARDRTTELRARVSAILDTRSLDAELALLGPLFERYDPAAVAAALLALSHQPSDISSTKPMPERAEVSAPSRVKIFVNIGKKDRASAKDLVGALIKEVKLDKSDIGRIDVRETFCVVEVSATAAQRAVDGLSGTAIRGRRIAARLDRAG